MKVVCVDNSLRKSNSCNLTIGKVYEAKNDPLHWERIGLKIENDKGEYHHYYHKRFETIENFREIRLLQLEIE